MADLVNIVLDAGGNSAAQEGSNGRTALMVIESVKDALTENIKGSLPVYAQTSIETHVHDVSC